MDLKITIGADLNAAIAQVNALAAGVSSLSTEAASASTTTAAMLAKIPAALRPLNAAPLTALSSAVKALKTDLASTAVSSLPTSLAAISPAATAASGALKSLKPGANEAGRALIDIGRIAQDAPFGFIGIQNNISPLIESFGRLKASTGSTGGALKALVSGIGGAGGLGLAVSAITAAVTFASIGFDRWIPKIKEAKKEVVDLDSIIRSGASIQQEATASVDSQIAKVTALARVVTDESKTYAERNNALGQLKETNKSYFGDLDLEAAKTGLLTSKVQEYTKALVAQAVVKGFQDDLSKVAVERAKQAVQLQDQLKAQDKLKRQFDEEQVRRNKSLQSGNLGAAFQTSVATDPLVAGQKAIDETNETVQKLNKQFDFLKTSISGAVDETLKFQTLDTPGKTKKDADALKDQIKNLEAYRDAVGLTNVQFATLVSLREQLVRRDQKKLGLDDAQLAKEVVAIRNSNEQLEARAKAIEEVAKATTLVTGEKAQLLNLKVGIALNDQTTGKLDLSQTQRTLDDIARSANLNLPLTIALDKDVQDRIRRQVGELPLIGKPITVPTENLGVKQAIKNINTQLAATPITLPSVDETKLKKGLDKAFQATQAAFQRINDTIKSAITDSIVGLGEAIGTALGTGNIQSALSALAGTIASGLKQIGTAMIAYGTAKLLFDQALKSLNPAVAVVAGIGLVAAGTALQSAISQRKFATGGIVTGPTNALIGEAGPEAVFPLNQIKRFFPNMTGASGQQVFIPDVKIEGSTLRIVFNRDQNRAGGSYNF